jgi:hypothetical protein
VRQVTLFGEVHTVTDLLDEETYGLGSDSLSLWDVLTYSGVDIIYFTCISGEDS